MTPAELVSATSPAVNALGARFYFHTATLAAGKELGLDGFRFYALGRGGVLGDVESAVVTSAFGYFHPDVVDRIWNSAKEVLAPRAAAAAYLACNADLGRQVLGTVGGLDAFCAAAEKVCGGVNPAAFALYAGVAAEPLPDDLPGRAMQLLVVHRELRGSLHLVAIVASGLHPSHAHALRRPGDLETFGWPADLDPPDDAAARLAAADALTDDLAAAAYAPLSDVERRAFVSGVEAIDAAFAADDAA